MKYVAVEVKWAPQGGGFHGKRYVVPFAEDFVHAIMAKAVVDAARVQWPDADIQVVAGGSMDVTAHATFGASTSLRKRAHKDDAKVFNVQDYSGNQL